MCAVSEGEDRGLMSDGDIEAALRVVDLVL